MSTNRATWAPRRVLEDLERLALRAPPRAAFFDEAAARLKRAVPFDGACWHTLDPGSDLITHHQLQDIEDARAADFAVDADRMREFSADLGYQRRQRGGASVWPLVSVSLRVAFHRGLCDSSPNADLNARIAGSILSCFSGDLFDSTGLFRSLWLLRMSATTGDVAGMVEDLLQFDPPHDAAAPKLGPSPNPNEQRRRFPRN
jgi:hypothetical protein